MTTGEARKKSSRWLLTAMALQRCTPGAMVMYDPGKPQDEVVLGVQAAAGQ
jgi:hypothetical protein